MDDMRIGILKAGKGDSLLLSWEGNHMLIDSGTPSTLRKNRNPSLPPIKDIEFCLITHIDYDHIGGFLDFLSKAKRNDLHPDFLFLGNTLDLIRYKDNDEVGFRHGSALSVLISILNLKCKPLFSGDVLSLKNIKVTILSPTLEHIYILKEKWIEIEKELNKKDYSDEFVSLQKKKLNIDIRVAQNDLVKKPVNDLLNSTSIACLIEYKNKKALMLGDAHPEIISRQLKNLLKNQQIEKIDIDVVKISHHGSKHNTTLELLSLINCNRYIISTDGSRPYNHPDIETINKIIINAINVGFPKIYFYFNYHYASEFEIINEADFDIEICKIVTNEIIL
ncbi:MBL fold metallo-hydrolase [Kosakonia cowanii]|uniref:ComEC/Rec2 family competence protein n=1 Tax=Kosakonia cowanii TaxID=208223 RepID=UPI0029C75EB4|nr:MBL fold metallo-hydrolase [Kosakonia cowanii]WPG21423.1 MBL fold metallo-hydrolase [Kosakonia cowanii]